MSYPSPTINCFLFTQCCTVPCSTHSFGNFAFSLAVLVEYTKHAETSCNFRIAFSVPLQRFTSRSWKAWCSLASSVDELGSSLACSAEKPSRDFKRSCSFVYGAENNPFCCLWETASGRKEDTEVSGRTICSFLLLEGRCKNLHRSPDFSYFFLCIYFLSLTGLFCIWKCCFCITSLVSMFSLCSASSTQR